MANGTHQTEFQLPTHSKHGVIMKTSAFLDLQTKQKSWCIANKTVAGDWTVLEYKTELFPSEDPAVENALYSNGRFLTYGDAVKLLVEYELLRKNSGMFVATEDYLTTKNIPNYRDVAHSDGIIFDREGNPHPTVHGTPITLGTFSTSEMMAVIDALQNPQKELSTAFAQAQHSAQQIFQHKAYAECTERTIKFIRAALDEIVSLGSTTEVTYKQRVIPFRVNSRGLLKYGKNNGEFSQEKWSDEYTETFSFGQKRFNRVFNEIHQSLENNLLLTDDLRKECLDFLYGLGIVLSSQILHVTHSRSEVTKINNVEIKGMADLTKLRAPIMEAERNTVKDHIKAYGSKKISKKELEAYVDQICATALGQDFPKHIDDVQKIGNALIGRLNYALGKVESKPAVVGLPNGMQP